MAAGIVFMWICRQKHMSAAGRGSRAVWALPHGWGTFQGTALFPPHPLSNMDLTQAASRKSRIHGLSKTLGVIESEERKPECSTFPKALALTRLWPFFFFFKGENPLKQEQDNCGVLAAPASLPPPEQLFRPPVQPGRTRKLQIRLESET